MPEEVKNAIRCSNPKCKKVIGSVELTDGKVSIKCKCGTTTTIEAKPHKYIQNAPYQDRLDLEQKG